MSRRGDTASFADNSGLSWLRIDAPLLVAPIDKAKAPAIIATAAIGTSANFARRR